MKTAEHRLRDDSLAVANPMATQHRRDFRTIRNAGSQTRVWTAAIVMCDPLPKNVSKVTLVQRDDRAVHTLRVDAVVIVNDKSMGLIA